MYQTLNPKQKNIHNNFTLATLCPLKFAQIGTHPFHCAVCSITPATCASGHSFWVGALKDEVKSTATKFLVEIFKLVVFCVGSAK